MSLELESLQYAYFSTAAPQVNAQALWSAAFGAPPLNFSSLSPGFTSADAPLGGFNVVVQVNQQASRIDLFFYPMPFSIVSGLFRPMTISDPAPSVAIAAKWMQALPRGAAARLAVIGSAIQPAASQEEAAAMIIDIVPELSNHPKALDINIQLNVRTNIGGSQPIEINRLCRWFNGQKISTDLYFGQQMAGGFNGQAVTAVYIDVNTVPDVKIAKAKIAPVYVFLRKQLLQILADGSRALV